MPKLLITSFTTWLPHQKSNSADDLLELIHPISTLDLVLLRHLPVDINLATKEVIKAISQHQPSALVCCGMAESRDDLAIEVQAFAPHNYSSKRELDPNKPLATIVDLPQITQGLVTTTLSYDAGKFVCEGLYYEVLSYLYQSSPPLPCIFVHVPRLTSENQLVITAEFSLILKNLANSDKINRDHYAISKITNPKNL